MNPLGRSGIRVVIAVSCLVAGLTLPTVLPAVAAARRSPAITFYFGLKRPEAQAQAAFFAVGRPGSSTYRRFLSLSQISSRYGASPQTKRAFLRGISALGLRARIDPSGVFARVSGTVRRFDSAFRVRIKSEFLNFPNVEAYFLSGRQTLRLPAALRPLVQDVVTDFSHSQAVPPGQGAAGRPAAAPSPPRNLGTWVRGCRAARALGTYSYAQVRKAYGISSLGNGARASVAILNVGEDAPSGDIAANARCFGYPRAARPDAAHRRPDAAVRARDVRARGGSGPGPRHGPGPALADLQQGVAGPGAVVSGQLRRSCPSDPLPDTYSMSYGECEKSVRGRGAGPSSRAGADLMDSMLVRLGLAGVSTFASAGDFGSTCDGQPFAGVAWPASSPYVTAVGGTRLILNPANQRVNEVVWNDLTVDAGQSGRRRRRAAACRRSPHARPISAGSVSPAAAAAIPDISANASNFPGWPVVLAGHWEVDGGTSAAAPLMAGAFALLDAAQRARGRPRLGPVNGLLYRLRATSPRIFFDIVSGANGYSRRVRAWRARPGYDLASGLGVPQFARLARAIPPRGSLRLGVSRRVLPGSLGPRPNLPRAYLMTGMPDPSDRHPLPDPAPVQLSCIGVVVHPSRDIDQPLEALRAWDRQHGSELIQIPVVGQDRRVATTGEPEDCDLIVAIGGDGTMLAALRSGASPRPPGAGRCLRQHRGAGRDHRHPRRLGTRPLHPGRLASPTAARAGGQSRPRH